MKRPATWIGYLTLVLYIGGCANLWDFNYTVKPHQTKEQTK